MPSSCRRSYEKSKTSKAFAIKSMCAECSGYDRKVVRDCTDEGCPLWPHRPFQKSKGKGENDEEEVDDVGLQPITKILTKASRQVADGASSRPPGICCEAPDIKKSAGKKECLNCGKTWRRKPDPS